MNVTVDLQGVIRDLGRQLGETIAALQLEQAITGAQQAEMQAQQFEIARLNLLLQAAEFREQKDAQEDTRFDLEDRWSSDLPAIGQI